MPDNIPLPHDGEPADDPFDVFIQHDLDLDELTDDEDWDEWEDDGVTVTDMRSRFSSRPFETTTASSVPPHPVRHWWREHFDDLFMLLIVVLLLAAWLIGKVEHQQTVDSLNATISAQQAQIADLQATLAAVDGGP